MANTIEGQSGNDNRMIDNMDAVLGGLRAEARTIDQYMQEDLARLEPAMDARLLEVLNYGLFNGGKRVRPLLAMFASRLCGNTDREVYKLGCAFEYLHAATLFHDDIIDNSETRRGKQSVFKKFGITAAILAGDFLHALAMATVGELAGVEGLRIFCNATTGMVDGEFMQLRNAERHNLSELDYNDAIMGKTGLLIAAACEIGAVYGRGSAQQVAALREYGVSLGCAFQIVDDLLDYLGDPVKTGKTTGNDLVEGKITLPLILTMNAAGEGDKARLLSILADKSERIAHFPEVCALVAKYDGFAAARKRAETAVANAVRSLTLFTGQDVLHERTLLEGLAGYVLAREK
ncbi:MAG TPA: polyprenyl synthetase family protein [Desulfobulbaceae bacterium]|nr:polyprenyl synthetase family protein [Desulfobulbaceae bacterium]